MDRMMSPQSFQKDGLALALKRELRTGERVMWQQRQIPRVSRKGFALYLFAIPWTAFAIFWTAMASTGAASMQEETGFISWAFPLFGVPFILVGLGMLSLPFVPLWNRGKMLYAITDQRLLRIYLGRSINVDSVPARKIGAIKRSERRDGTGSIKVHIGSRRDSDGDPVADYFEIEEVADILAAHDHIADLAKTAT